MNEPGVPRSRLEAVSRALDALEDWAQHAEALAIATGDGTDGVAATPVAGTDPPIFIFFKRAPTGLRGVFSDETTSELSEGDLIILDIARWPS